MDDTTELIQALAQQVVTVVKQSLSQRHQTHRRPRIWRGSKRRLRDVLRQVGAEALGQWLSSAQHTPEAERACACGGKLHYQRLRPATVLSVFGRVTYDAGVLCRVCACGEGCAPVDELLRLAPGPSECGTGRVAHLGGGGISL